MFCHGKYFFASFTFALILSLAGISFPSFTLAETNIPVIHAAADPAGAPFAFEEDGIEKGFDVDLLTAIGDAAGLDIKVRSMPWTGVLPSLQSGSLDVSENMITITKSRMKFIDFSNAYYRGGYSILVRNDSSIDNLEDLKGHIIGGKKAAAAMDFLVRQGIPNNNLKQFQSIASAYGALVSGSVDAVVHDNAVNVSFLKDHNDKVKLVGDLLEGQYYGIAVSKHRPELVNKLNQGLASIQKSGTYARIVEKWFGPDDPGMVTTVITPSKAALDE